MKKKQPSVTKYLFYLLLVLLLPLTVLVILKTKSDKLIHVRYVCEQGKSIAATYNLTRDNVFIVLSDGRMFTLPRAMSGSGARYTTPDEAVVFWNKGTTAFILEQDKETFTGCNQQ